MLGEWGKNGMTQYLCVLCTVLFEHVILVFGFGWYDMENCQTCPDVIFCVGRKG